MTGPPPNAETTGGTDDGTGARPDREATTGAPRWVKVSGIIVIVLVLLFVILQLTGIGGSHGPGQHASSGALGDPASLSIVVERGVR